jgi:hypothetical protein
MTNPRQFIKTTDENTKKYLTDTPYTNSYNSAAVSVGVGSYATRTFVVPLSADTRFFSLWVNVSLDDDLYVKIPNRDRLYASNVRTIATTVAVNNGNATITMYLVNTSGSTQNFPDFTVNVIRRDYTDEG